MLTEWTFQVPPERKEFVLKVYHRNMSLQPLSLRAMEGFEDLDLISKTVGLKREDGGTEGYTELLEPWSEVQTA